MARITASDNEALNLCGCPTKKRASSSQGSGRRSSKHARKSSITRKHGDDCPLFSVLNARAEERERMRSVFVNLMTELRSGVCDLVKRAEDRDSHLTLLDTMDALKVEKLQMESKVRHLEVSHNIRPRLKAFYLPPPPSPSHLRSKPPNRPPFVVVKLCGFPYALRMLPCWSLFAHDLFVFNAAYVYNLNCYRIDSLMMHLTWAFFPCSSCPIPLPIWGELALWHQSNVVNFFNARIACLWSLPPQLFLPIPPAHWKPLKSFMYYKASK